ncbi:proline dehydrogenase, partial [Staphylococcus succinus]
MTVIKSCLFSLSQSGNLNKLAKKLGPKLGIHSFIAGTNLVELETNIYRLNNRGVAVTIDNLGEFVYYEKDAIEATSRILDVIDRIYLKELNGHISIKLTQIGLDIDDKICLNNATKIIDYADQKNIFVNIDMEDFNHIEASWNIIHELTAKYSNIGTVIQAALYRAESDVKQNKNMKLRIVKGAYKESANISFQMKKEIDNNFLKLTKMHLLDGAFTSIATHDHNI